MVGNLDDIKIIELFLNAQSRQSLNYLINMALHAQRLLLTYLTINKILKNV